MVRQAGLPQMTPCVEWSTHGWYWARGDEPAFWGYDWVGRQEAAMSASKILALTSLFPATTFAQSEARARQYAFSKTG